MKNTCTLGRLLLALSCTTLPLAVVAADATPAAKAQLGRVLFFDTSLSEPAGQSCATCHAPGAAFTDPDTTKPTSNALRNSSRLLRAMTPGWPTRAWEVS